MLHQGACHCGKVRFQIETENPRQGIYRCNCSLCRKKSIIMKPVAKEKFTLLEGQNFLTLYQWNKQIAQHFFCKICGIYTHHQRRSNPGEISVNLECLEGVETPPPEQIGLADGAGHD